jgi:hypothetical protein
LDLPLDKLFLRAALRTAFVLVLAGARRVLRPPRDEDAALCERFLVGFLQFWLTSLRIENDPSKFEKWFELGAPGFQPEASTSSARALFKRDFLILTLKSSFRLPGFRVNVAPLFAPQFELLEYALQHPWSSGAVAPS